MVFRLILSAYPIYMYMYNVSTIYIDLGKIPPSGVTIPTGNNINVR